MSTQNAQNPPKKAGLLIALDGLFSIAVLAVAGYYIKLFFTSIGQENASGHWELVALMFLCMAICQGIRMVLARGKHHLDVLRHTVYMVVFLACAALIMFSRQTAAAVLDLEGYAQDIHFKLVTWLYEGSLIFSRVLTILRDRNRRSTWLNIGLIAVIVVLMYEMEMIWMILIIGWQCVAHVATITFARLDLGTLRKIARRTYAAEILFGIVLLIVAFSLVLPLMEDGIPTFEDALWYCFAIVTTIGFGDFSAVTPIGRILSVILGVYGIIVVALITSIIVNFYGEMKSNEDEG